MAYNDFNNVDEAIGKAESGNNPAARNPASTATGQFQIIEPTYKGLQKNYPDLPRTPWEDFRKDPAKYQDEQKQFAQAIRTENSDYLSKRGLEPTPTNLYMLHYFGSNTGTNILKAKDDASIVEYVPQNAIVANRLNPNMTVGELRAQVGGRMDKALGATGAGQQPFRVDITGTGEEIQNAGQGVQAPKTPWGYTPQHTKQLNEIDASVSKILKLQQGTPEYNIAVADAVKKSPGPNWTNAFMSALFGQKEQSLMWITGGRPNQPKISEAYIDGQLKQIVINSNERGDQWFTDPATGKKLPDNIQITATSPEGSLQTARIGEAEKTGVTKPMGNRISSQALSEVSKEESAITAWSKAMPGNGALLEDIGTNTQKFSTALDNITRGPAGSAFLDAVKGFFKGSIDDTAIKSAAAKAGIQPQDMGAFVQYLRSIDTINKRDAQLKTDHAPGSGTAGELTLEGGSQGINQWLAKRTGNHAMQSVWNDYFLKNKESVGSVAGLQKGFLKSAEYDAVRNFERYRSEGRDAKIPNGAPFANFDRSGNLIIQKWNATKKRGE
jgi:hypothetical protein